MGVQAATAEGRLRICKERCKFLMSEVTLKQKALQQYRVTSPIRKQSHRRTLQ